MNRTTITRLSALEARAPASAPQATLTRLHSLQVRALAVLIGGLEERQAPAEGLARALGYDGGRELREAMRAKAEGQADPDGFDARWRRALFVLCERYGLDPETAGEADLDALLDEHDPARRSAPCLT